jgi:hypothetical protein
MGESRKLCAVCNRPVSRILKKQSKLCKSCTDYVRTIGIKYGVTLDRYLWFLEKQKRRCAICGLLDHECGSRNRRGLVVDHCHVTNIVRGLICQPCNTLLGGAKDNVIVLQSAIDYLNAPTNQLVSGQILLEFDENEYKLFIINS